MRKRVEIEQFLRWAYRDELPKVQTDTTMVGPAGFGGAWGGVEQYGEVGTLIDFAQENRWGVVPDRYARDDPHPDAERAARAVMSLDKLDLCLPDDWSPISDLGDLGLLGKAAVAAALADLTVTGRDGRRTLRGGVRRLVFRHALLGGCPPWEIEPPTVKLVCGGNGKPAWFRRETVEGEAGPVEIEVDGMNRKLRIPHHDAYQKPHLDPCPVEGIVDRGLHEVYVAALGLLHAELVDNLTDHALEPSPRAARPWEDGAPPERRILLGRAPAALIDAPIKPGASPAAETPFVAPTGLKRALAPLKRKKEPARSLALA